MKTKNRSKWPYSQMKPIGPGDPRYPNDGYDEGAGGPIRKPVPGGPIDPE